MVVGLLMPGKNRTKKWKREQLDLGLKCVKQMEQIDLRGMEQVRREGFPESDSAPSKSSGAPASAAESESHPSYSSTTPSKVLAVLIESYSVDEEMVGSEELLRATLPECDSCAPIAIFHALNTKLARMEQENKCQPCLQHARSVDTSSLSTMISGSKDAKSASPPLPGTPEKTLLRAVLSTLTSEEQAVLTSRVRRNVQSYLAKLGTTSTRETHQPDTEER